MEQQSEATVVNVTELIKQVNEVGIVSVRGKLHDDITSELLVAGILSRYKRRKAKTTGLALWMKLDYSHH